jgi:cold shock CspA family protein
MPIGTQRRGTVKHFKQSRGYGFIRADGGDEFFFHINDYDEQSDYPTVGTRVRFIEGVNPRNNKPLASKVEPLQN